jgi:hypothetical protein
VINLVRVSLAGGDIGVDALATQLAISTQRIRVEIIEGLLTDNTLFHAVAARRP